MVVLVKWLGHASFELKSAGEVVYFDPYEGEYVDKADLILVSHSHYDHCDTAKIGKIRKADTLVVAPADCAAMLGVKVKSLKPGEQHSFRDMTIEAVEAYNCKRFRSPGNPYHPKGLGVGYLVKVDGKTVYHAGDTDFIPEMRSLRDIDLALLPTGGTYTMDSIEAAEAALAINPKYVIPMHRWDTNPEEFKKKVEAESRIRVLMLRKGEQTEIP
jgi:L-ascorbate metabolism protein UlaG (beta-lactamase superfamily)